MPPSHIRTASVLVPSFRITAGGDCRCWPLPPASARLETPAARARQEVCRCAQRALDTIRTTFLAAQRRDGARVFRRRGVCSKASVQPTRHERPALSWRKAVGALCPARRRPVEGWYWPMLLNGHQPLGRRFSDASPRCCYRAHGHKLRAPIDPPMQQRRIWLDWSLFSRHPQPGTSATRSVPHRHRLSLANAARGLLLGEHHRERDQSRSQGPLHHSTV